MKGKMKRKMQRRKGKSSRGRTQKKEKEVEESPADDFHSPTSDCINDIALALRRFFLAWYADGLTINEIMMRSRMSNKNKREKQQQEKTTKKSQELT